MKNCLQPFAKFFALLFIITSLSIKAFAAAPDNLYLLGAISQTGSAPVGKYDWTGLRFEKDGENYRLNDVEFFPSIGNLSEFMISLANGSFANTKNQTFGSNISPEETDGEYQIELKRQLDNTSVAIKIVPGKYNLLLEYHPATSSSNDTTLLKITDASDIETGIEDVNATLEVPVEYFTLSGIKVAKPEGSGIYICRQASRVWKTVIIK